MSTSWSKGDICGPASEVEPAPREMTFQARGAKAQGGDGLTLFAMHSGS